MGKKPTGVDVAGLTKKFTIMKGKVFSLADIDPGETGKIADMAAGKQLLAELAERLNELQEKLYAQNQWAVLLIFQAMDAAGKDGTIREVMKGVDPQGCQVFSFKTPTSEELDHDYLWRCMKCLPERGRMGIFNRSYYEETLVVRVHPAYLSRQHLPSKCVNDNIWEERFTDINAFERYLTNNGVVIRKFFLHVSREEQGERFLKRLDKPNKNWKFSAGDVAERGHWDEYQRVYQETIRATATSRAPWVVVPADHKWFTRVVVAASIVQTLESLDLSFPKVSAERGAELKEAATALRREMGK